MPSPANRARFERVRDALPWNRLAVGLAVVAFGFSQILFQVIVENPAHFPRHAGFHLWVLFWILLLPFGVVTGVETVIALRWPDGRAFRLWRSLLYAILAMSFLRQLQAHYSVALDRFILLELFLPLTLLIGAAVFWATFRLGRSANLYAGYLGLLACILVGSYLYRSGLLGAAWIESADRPMASSADAGSPPVWILLCDELSYEAVAPGGRIDEENFPNLAALARESVWFSNATTTHFWTHAAVPAILTGRRVPAEGTPTIFQLLPEERSALIIDPWLPTTQWIRQYGGDKDRLHFRGRIEILGRGPLEVGEYLLATLAESSFIRLPAAAANRQGASLYTYLEEEIRMLYQSVDPRTAPGRITYWHCPLPHSPFIFHRDGSRRPTPLAFPRYGYDPEAPDAVAPDEGWKAYREQASYLDGILGEFLRRLRSAGLYENAVILLTSDHGLRNGGALEPEGYPRVMGGIVPHVPLLIRAPGLSPRVEPVDYQHIDLVPTLLEVLDVPYDEDAFEGRSALSGPRPPREKFFNDQDRRYVYDPDEGVWRADP